VLTERGLAPRSRAGARAPVPVEVARASRRPAAARRETTAYFTVAEALTNVAKYAERQHATVRLAQEDGALVVEVRDDGVGGARGGTGSGLSGLADRVGALRRHARGRQPAGEGTLVRAVLPVHERRGHAGSRRRARRGHIPEDGALRTCHARLGEAEITESGVSVT
jgi:signal transduction histidine kinase